MSKEKRVGESFKTCERACCVRQGKGNQGDGVIQVREYDTTAAS